MSSIANTSAGTESHAARILRNLFAGYQGNLEIRLWDGTSLRFGQLPACAALVFRDPLPLTRAILARDPLQLVDGHIRGAIDIEGDMYMALEIRHFLSSLKLSWPATAALLINTLTPRSRQPRDHWPRLHRPGHYSAVCVDAIRKTIIAKP